MLLLGVAAAIVPLQPITTWRVEAEQSYCMLAREFEAAGSRVSVAFQSYGGGTTFEMIIIAPAAAGNKASAGEAKISLGEGTPTISAKYLSSLNPDKTKYFIQIRAPKMLLSKILQGNTLIAQAGPTSLAWRVPESAKAHKALMTCQDELIQAMRDGTAVSSASDDPKVVVAARLEPGQLTRLFGDPENYPDDAR